MFFGRKQNKKSDSKITARYTTVSTTGKRIEYVEVKRERPIPPAKVRKRKRK